MVPHNNQLQKQYGERGLQVIGVTGESLEDTLPWVEKHGLKHAYAFDTGGALMNALRIAGLPTALLVDPLGRIVWRGHPNALRSEHIESALAQALPLPIWAWPAELAELKAALLEERFSAALTLGSKVQLEGFAGKLPKLIDARIENRIAGLEQLLAELDVRALEQRLPLLEAGLEGHAGLTRLAAISQRLKEDPELGAAREAQMAVVQLAAEVDKRTSAGPAPTLEEVEAWSEQLSPITKRFPRSAPGREAKVLGRKLKDLRKALKAAAEQPK